MKITKDFLIEHDKDFLIIVNGLKKQEDVATRIIKIIKELKLDDKNEREFEERFNLLVHEGNKQALLLNKYKNEVYGPLKKLVKDFKMVKKILKEYIRHNRL